MLTAILLIGVSLIACARARADKLFQGIPINSNTCQAHRKRYMQPKVLWTLFYFFFYFYLFFFFQSFSILVSSYFIPIGEEKNILAGLNKVYTQRYRTIGRSLSAFMTQWNIVCEMAVRKPAINRSLLQCLSKKKKKERKWKRSSTFDWLFSVFGYLIMFKHVCLRRME